jgi:hypothetical protein
MFTIFSTIVAPSFVTATSPSGDTNILSIPFGPRDEDNVLATAFAANILLLYASKPLSLFFEAYSLKIK